MVDASHGHGQPSPSSTPSTASLYPVISGYMASQAIHVAARLGIADLIAAGTNTSEALARATETHASSLHRLLRALVGLGLLEQIMPTRFALTPLGSTLRTEVPGSLRNAALYFGSELMWQGWGELLRSIRTGETAMRHLHGMGTFEYRAEHPEQAAVFNGAMSELTRQVAAAVVAVYDFSKFERIVDVGGGNGTLVAAILAATPHLRGVVFDIPSGVAEAGSRLEAAGVAHRCEIVEGDFFHSVPSGADAYIMKSIIHDWDDARSVTILRNCRRAISAHGKLLIVERIIPARVDPSIAHRQVLMMDLNMLVMAGGQERTEAEYRALLASAGFNLTAIVPDRAPTNFSILEAAPTQLVQRP
jgi:ubiquinone/menaquinone biosynthesis C-methylase UbiE